MAKKQKNKDFKLVRYFVGGKMKHRRVPLIEGLVVEEFIRGNADDGFLMAHGYYEVPHEREMERGAANNVAERQPGERSRSVQLTADDDDEEEVPF